jgi:hypothetical protein
MHMAATELVMLEVGEMGLTVQEQIIQVMVAVPIQQVEAELLLLHILVPMLH